MRSHWTQKQENAAETKLPVLFPSLLSHKHSTDKHLPERELVPIGLRCEHRRRRRRSTTIWNLSITTIRPGQQGTHSLLGTVVGSGPSADDSGGGGVVDAGVIGQNQGGEHYVRKNGRREKTEAWPGF